VCTKRVKTSISIKEFEISGRSAACKKLFFLGTIEYAVIIALRYSPGDKPPAFATKAQVKNPLVY
jgi:hypothetical protein